MCRCVLAILTMRLLCCFVVPGPPVDLRAEVSQSHPNSPHTVDVRLTWKPPTHANGVIRSYEISLSTNSTLPDYLWTSIVSNGMVTVLSVAYNVIDGVAHDVISQD